MLKVRKTPSLSSLSRNNLNIPSARWSHHRTGTHDLVILLLAPCGPPFSECERLFDGCRWLDDSPSHVQHYINRRVGVKLPQHSLLSYCCAAEKFDHCQSLFFVFSIRALSGTIIRGTLKTPNSQLVTPISTKLQRPDGCD
jgi:hypothetical protein